MFRDATANDAPDVGEEQVRVQVDWTRPAKFKYVALGDSFSAGEGIEEFFEPKTSATGPNSRTPRWSSDLVPTECRSASSPLLPRPVSRGVFRRAAVLRPRTCSSVSSRGTGQLTLGTRTICRFDTNTDLVTITVGGNDVKFSEILRFCAFSDDCTAERYHGKPLNDVATDRFTALGRDLDRVASRNSSSQSPVDRNPTGLDREINRLTRSSVCGSASRGSARRT